MNDSAHAPTLSPRNERWLLFSLTGVQFTHIVDFMIMMPLGPQFTRLFGISDAQFGVLVSAYTLAAGASGLLASSYIDRFERKRLLLWLYAGFALATLACGLAPTYGLLMAARVLAGLFGGVMGALVQTMVGDAIPFERRGRAMGMVMSSFAMATVAGVPASLWLAEWLGWHAPFIAIGLLSGAIWLAASYSLPVLAGHLRAQRTMSPWQGVLHVLRDANHWRAFTLSALMMTASFVVIPYLTIYSTTNVGIRTDQIPVIYLVGGLATLVSARVWGVLADRWGKVRTLRLVAICSMAPILATTHLVPVPFWMVLVVTTAFFVFVSGRMVPGMAIITSAAQPHWRGTFMSLNSAVQSGAMGVAALVGGLLIHRSPAGLVQGYDWAGWVAVATTLVLLPLAGRVKMFTARPDVVHNEQ